MTTATREPPNLQGPCPGAERMVWPVQTHPAQSTGPESKRNSGDGGYFSLDFSFNRRALPGAPQRRRSPVGEGPTQGGCWLNLVASCEAPEPSNRPGRSLAIKPPLTQIAFSAC